MTNALRASVGIDEVNGVIAVPLRNSIIGAFRFAHAAADAFLGYFQRHGQSSLSVNRIAL